MEELRPRAVVVGAGAAGVLAAIRLPEAGYDVAVYEKGDRVGGTWRENTYPGLACDVPSHLYCYSFAPNPRWSRLFSPGAEIREYLEDVARRHGVLDRIRFGAEVTALDWLGDRWRVTLDDGGVDHADVVVAATGVLHHPRLPDLAGLDSFAGPAFHSARWDHSVPVDGRRVGLVGTGSTAVQITGALSSRVAELHLFQRTAQWVLPVANPAVAAEDQARLAADPGEVERIRELFRDRFEAGANAFVDATSDHLAHVQRECEANLATVEDPELREALRPDYRAACKRLVVSPDFYEAVQRPSVQLVTSGIDRVEPAGVRTVDGQLHELDVLVLATGFRVDRFLRPTAVTGRDGTDLDAVWSARPSAHNALTVPGFPNLFLLNGPNGPVGNFSLITVAELQMQHVLDLLAGAGGRPIEPRQEALDRFEAARVEAAKQTIWVTGCKSWYLDDRGVPMAWPWTFQRFREVMAAPDLAEYRVG